MQIKRYKLEAFLISNGYLEGAHKPQVRLSVLLGLIETEDLNTLPKVLVKAGISRWTSRGQLQQVRKQCFVSTNTSLKNKIFIDYLNRNSDKKLPLGRMNEIIR